MQLERRARVPRALLLGAPVAAVLATLAITSLLVAWAGAPVGRAYAALLEAGFGSRFAITETLDLVPGHVYFGNVYASCNQHNLPGGDWS